MVNRDLYDAVCTSGTALTGVQRQELRDTVVNGLGLPVSALFPDFALAFPEVVSVMESHYAVPVVLFRKHMDMLMPSLVSEGDSRNIFFDLVPLPLETEGSKFEEYCAMLPPRWKELYRHFWSFQVTERSKKSMDWTNTPFSYSGRLTIERYRVLRGVKKRSSGSLFVARRRAPCIHCIVGC